METYTLLAIDRVNGTRIRKARFKPQKGLTEDDLESIKKRELVKLWKQHPEMDEKKKRDDLAIMLLYVEEQKS